jgi:chromosome segregation ATPase
MKRPVLFVWIAVVAVLLGAGGFAFMKYRQAASDYTAMKALEEDTRTRYGDAINEIVMIQDSLNAIVLGDSAAQLVPSDLVAERRLYETRGDIALARISVLKAGIERTKAKIQELDDNLKKSGVEVAGLQRMVGNLRRSVEAKEAQVAELTGQVDQLQTRVTGLTEVVEQNQDSLLAQAELIERKRREISTIYYAIGTKKQLTEAGLVVAKGGILGLGRTLEPSGHFDDRHFTAVDTDHERIIRIPSVKVQILSAQPPASYELQAVDGGIALIIRDSAAFRTIKHLLIVTS